MAQQHQFRPVLGGGGFGQVQQHFLVVDKLPESVGAQDKGVSWCGSLRLRIRLAGGLAQHPQQTGAVVIVVDVHIGDLAAQILLVGDGVVPGHGRQRSAGEVIDPGIPDVGPKDPVPLQAEEGGGGLHALLSGLGLLFQDLGVGVPEQGGEGVGIQRLRLETAIQQDIRRQGGGHLAALVASQAVRHHEDAPLSLDPAADAVLVVVPAPQVGVGKS